MQITAQHQRAFEEQGYTILRQALDEPTLMMLREECSYFVGYVDGSMKALGRETYGITHRGKRYFISGRYRESRRLPSFLFGQLMADITRAFLGDESYLFVEQWVVKGAEQGMKFAWHQDGGYVKFSDPETRHRPYLTCWCALDDMSEANGSIFVRPHDRANTRNHVLPHRAEPETNDLVGYEGSDPGVLIEVPAGSIVVFSSTTLHRSSANTTDAPRRAYLAQYSGEVIQRSTGGAWAHAVPFTRSGEVIYDPNSDHGTSGLRSPEID